MASVKSGLSVQGEMGGMVRAVEHGRSPIFPVCAYEGTQALWPALISCFPGYVPHTLATHPALCPMFHLNEGATKVKPKSGIPTVTLRTPSEVSQVGHLNFTGKL